ncbi:torsin-1A-interacting protein 2 isoform X1 [Tachysurus vachellii]|uniref:torsin-1A-interacting protein 2 isoform X1 n=1 Tax=Tachysurus vachellii TaxID=175792 RepID=UPI00296AFAFC|nr:torsin-1A-interacting protein 2 isoform X1 [Tachysurus vachellii]XP_060737894.1 torsin-1A-interacting protein 2 isoform X1 [Tachysurus vachellii]
MDGDTKQPLVDDKRECNLPKKIKQGGDAASCNSDKEEECYTDDGVDEVVDERSPNKNSGDASSEINQRVKRLQKKHVKRLDTEQPKDTDTRVYNQQKESKKDTEEASAQSDEERKACDTSVGKCIKVKNENNDVQPAGDGPRQRISNKKKNLAHLGKGDIPDHDAETKRSSVAADTFSWYILLAILLSLLALVVLIFWFVRTSSPPVEKEFTLLEIFYQEMDKVQESFPNQHREVWRRSRIHLKEHLNLTNPTEPVSLILTSGREAEKTLGCLAQRLAAAFSNAVNSSVLGIDGTSKSAQNSDDVKLDIDKTLKEAFESGTQAAVIHRFEELPPGSTLIFYRYCDHENSAFKKVFLAFTVMLQEEMAFPPNVSLGMVEEMVQEYLKEKFVSSDRTVEFNKMDLDKLSGLWSRISHLILPVAAEQKIEQNGCQT